MASRIIPATTDTILPPPPQPSPKREPQPSPQRAPVPARRNSPPLVQTARDASRISHVTFEERIIGDYKKTIDYSIWNVRGYSSPFGLITDLFYPGSGNTFADRAKRWWVEKCYLKYADIWDRLNMLLIVISFGILIAIKYWELTTSRESLSVSVDLFKPIDDDEIARRATLSAADVAKLQAVDDQKILEMVKADREFNNSAAISALHNIRVMSMALPLVIVCWEVFKRTTEHHRSAAAPPNSGHLSLSRAHTIQMLTRAATGLQLDESN